MPRGMVERFENLSDEGDDGNTKAEEEAAATSSKTEAETRGCHAGEEQTLLSWDLRGGVWRTPRENEREDSGLAKQDANQ